MSDPVPIPASTASSVLLAANQNRGCATVFNDSTATLYLTLGPVSSTTVFTTKVMAGGLYETPQPVHRGTISGVWSEANGQALAQDLT
jgi:hypothetical protein